MINENEKSVSSPNEHIITKIKKSLSKDLGALSLNRNALVDIEDLMIQDLLEIEKYNLIAEPNAKYTEKNPNAAKYEYNSTAELLNNGILLQNIKNYNIKYILRSQGLNIEVGLCHSLIYPVSTLYASGENQKLYYGKFHLLDKFFDSKRPWHWRLYSKMLYMSHGGSK